VSIPDLPPDEALNDERLVLIAESYQRLTGQALLDVFDPQDMWNAPRAIVAHGMEVDPVFFYGNKLALQLFEMSFAEFICLPSRFSAEPLAQQDRAVLLDRVTRLDFVDFVDKKLFSGWFRLAAEISQPACQALPVSLPG
jgi:hypothetical protein